jgi:hypothetical protein
MTRYGLLKYLFECNGKVSATEIEKHFGINYFEFNDAMENLKMEDEIDSNLKSVEADNWLSKERNKEVYYSLTPLGINNYIEKTEEKKSQNYSNIRSWIAIGISVIALVKSFL